METPDPARDRSDYELEVSVIVPARNEEASLGDCLESLAAQTGVSLEIIVVDDGSTDGTRGIAESFPGIQVICPGPLPTGWTGKNNAVFAGSQHARGEWLLFTDADTVHKPGSLACALKEARQHGAALLSYSPEQDVHGFWENAVMPVIFAELAATFKPSQVSDPASPTAAANGQYILITRESYDAVGGHAAVATSLLEDVEFARVVKTSGRKIFFRYGGDAVRTRMYRTFAQLREGWTKNLVQLFRSPAWLAVVRFAEFILIFGTLGLAVAALMTVRQESAVIAALSELVLLANFFRRIRRAHFAWDASLLSIFGLPIFSYLLLRSRLSYGRNRISWKGRTYASGAKTSPSMPDKNPVGTAVGRVS